MGSKTQGTEARVTLAYGPGHSGFEITPHDTNNLQHGSEDIALRALYVGGLGDVTGKVFDETGTPATLTWYNVPAGSTLHYAFIEVHVTGTTATNMLGFL